METKKVSEVLEMNKGLLFILSIAIFILCILSVTPVTAADPNNPCAAVTCNDGDQCTADSCNNHWDEAQNKYVAVCLVSKITNCCGDGICESGETGTTCAADCACPFECPNFYDTNYYDNYPYGDHKFTYSGSAQPVKFGSTYNQGTSDFSQDRNYFMAFCKGGGDDCGPVVYSAYAKFYVFVPASTNYLSFRYFVDDKLLVNNRQFDLIHNYGSFSYNFVPGWNEMQVGYLDNGDTDYMFLGLAENYHPVPYYSYFTYMGTAQDPKIHLNEGSTAGDCSDKIDNDGDWNIGLSNLENDGIAAPWFNTVKYPGRVLKDKMPNFGELGVDCFDSGCAGQNGPADYAGNFGKCNYQKESSCSDTYDNDFDGLTDNNDPDCKCVNAVRYKDTGYYAVRAQSGNYYTGLCDGNLVTSKYYPAQIAKPSNFNVCDASGNSNCNCLGACIATTEKNCDSPDNQYCPAGSCTQEPAPPNMCPTTPGGGNTIFDSQKPRDYAFADELSFDSPKIQNDMFKGYLVEEKFEEVVSANCECSGTTPSCDSGTSLYNNNCPVSCVCTSCQVSSCSAPQSICASECYASTFYGVILDKKYECGIGEASRDGICPNDFSNNKNEPCTNDPDCYGCGNGVCDDTSGTYYEMHADFYAKFGSYLGPEYTSCSQDCQCGNGNCDWYESCEALTTIPYTTYDFENGQLSPFTSTNLVGSPWVVTSPVTGRTGSAISLTNNGVYCKTAATYAPKQHILSLEVPIDSSTTSFELSFESYAANLAPSKVELSTFSLKVVHPDGYIEDLDIDSNNHNWQTESFKISVRSGSAPLKLIWTAEACAPYYAPAIHIDNVQIMQNSIAEQCISDCCTNCLDAAINLCGFSAISSNCFEQAGTKQFSVKDCDGIDTDNANPKYYGECLKIPVYGGGDYAEARSSQISVNQGKNYTIFGWLDTTALNGGVILMHLEQPGSSGVSSVPGFPRALPSGKKTPYSFNYYASNAQKLTVSFTVEGASSGYALASAVYMGESSSYSCSVTGCGTCGDKEIQYPNSKGIFEECEVGDQGVIASQCTGCKWNVTRNRCGNGVIENNPLGSYYEECEKGPAGFAANCDPISCKFKAPVCGNEVLDPGEECEVNVNGISEDKCTNCKFVCSCGNGIMNEGEECDPLIHGSTNCNPVTCTWASCGNGLIDPGEVCDRPGYIGSSCPYSCASDCKSVRDCGVHIAASGYGSCGDGIIQSPNSEGQEEECDDGNGIYSWNAGYTILTKSPSNGGCNYPYRLNTQTGVWSLRNDSCSHYCRILDCTQSNPYTAYPKKDNNGYVEGTEECDDGLLNDGNDVCNTDGIYTWCGDGILQRVTGEECEPRNTPTCDINCRKIYDIQSVVVNPSTGCSGRTCGTQDYLGVTLVLKQSLLGSIRGDVNFTGSAGGIVKPVNDPQRQTSGLIGYTSSSSPNACKAQYFAKIENVPEFVKNTHLQDTVGKLSDSSESNRSANVYSGQSMPIYLDACPNYVWDDYVIDGVVAETYKYKVSMNDTKCYMFTCGNYYMKDVLIEDDRDDKGCRLEGVSLYDHTRKDWSTYHCVEARYDKVTGTSITGEDAHHFNENRTMLNFSLRDGICPDDFAAPTAAPVCGFNDSASADTSKLGICSRRSIVDYDCVPKTKMKCGDGVVVYQNPRLEKFFKDTDYCTYPQPPLNVHRCYGPSQCVGYDMYAHEPKCYDLYDVINTTNEYGNVPITCSFNNTWCPEGFKLELELPHTHPFYGKCVKESATPEDLECEKNPYPKVFACDMLYNPNYEPCTDTLLRKYTSVKYCEPTSKYSTCAACKTRECFTKNGCSEHIMIGNGTSSSRTPVIFDDCLRMNNDTKRYYEGCIYTFAVTIASEKNVFYTISNISIAPYSSDAFDIIWTPLEDVYS